MYDFSVLTVWDNPTVVNNEVDGVRVCQLAKSWFGRFRQIKAMVVDKRNTVLDFQMEIFIPLAIIFSLLGYNVVSTIHGISWWNPKISWLVRKLIYLTDILGVNLVRRMIFVSKSDFDKMRKYTFRKYYYIPNGSAPCEHINQNPDRDMVFIGRISVHKNLINLIKAATKYGRKLDIYGPFDMRESSYAEQIKDLLSKSECVKYCGMVASDKIYSTISCYKCVVNASKAEACPNSVIEAAACGLYLYLSDIPGHRNLGYPDVHYFDPENIDLTLVEGVNHRSERNVEHHLREHSIQKQVNNYSKVYESFS